MHMEKFHELSCGNGEKCIQEEESNVSTHCLFDLPSSWVKSLMTLRLDLTALYVIYYISNKGYVPADEYFAGSIQKLQRRNYLSKNQELTELSIRLLEELTNIKQSSTSLDKISPEEGFNNWWEIYPGTDMFEYKGITFPGSQAKKRFKMESKKEYIEIVKGGSYTISDINDATLLNIIQAKELSITKNESQIHYIPHSLRYLQLRCFEPFVLKARQLRSENKINDIESKPNSDQFDFDL